MDNRAVGVDHYENFPVASWLCPVAVRPAVVAIYHFARTADDIADEGDASTAERLTQLERYERALVECAAGRVAGDRWPAVFDPLRRAMAEHALPVPQLSQLLSAFKQDTRNPLYEDRAELLDYCARSANPIGRLLLHLVGVHDASALRQSDAICTALQLINFWQDLSIDSARGRCYVTRIDALRHGLDLPLPLPDSPSTRALVRELVEWSRALMMQGSPLVHRIEGLFAWELRLVVQGGLSILDNIEALGYDSMSRRPSIGKFDTPRLLWRALLMRRGLDAPLLADGTAR